MFFARFSYIPKMIEIKDINDERISLYKSLRFTPNSHVKGKIFVAENEKVVRKLLKSDIEVLSFFGLSEYCEKYADELKKNGVVEKKIFYAVKSLMNRIVGFNLHAGIMAIGRRAEADSLDELGDRIVCLESIVDSENVGAIVRNSAAFGFDSVLFDRETSSPWMRRAVRVSMGSVFECRTLEAPILSDSLENLKKSGYKIVVFERAESSISPGKLPFCDKVVAVFGSEGAGVSAKVLEIADTICEIPLSGKVDSLNVASCAAIALRELSGLR